MRLLDCRFSQKIFSSGTDNQNFQPKMSNMHRPCAGIHDCLNRENALCFMLFFAFLFLFQMLV